MREKQGNGPYNIFAETGINIEFYDLDPMKIVWHGNYIKYFETGRRVLLEKIKFGFKDMEEAGFAFPIIELSAKYIEPLRFNDKVIIKAILMEYENRLKIKYEIRNDETGIITTKGMSTQMAINMIKNESCFVCPKILIDKVEALFGREKQ
ncbi:MAG: acyl-CoA thioesterase [Treponema sp.]|nr:acyl-CoA thioesterase [Treponema sp.]